MIVPRRPHLLGEVLVVLCLLRVYDFVRSAAEVRGREAVHNGEALLRLESHLHIDVEHAANAWTAGHRLLTLASSDVYQFAHVGVSLIVLVACWLWRPDLYRPARNALVAINVTGLAVFFLVPVAPPRLLPGGGFVDTVALAGFGPSHGGPVAADQYGALPSLHLAWAVWCAVIVARMTHRQLLRRAAWAYPFFITVVVVVTGNHYLVDAVAGTAVALLALTLTRARHPVARVAESDRVDAAELLPAG